MDNTDLLLVKTTVETLARQLTVLGQRAENEGHKPGETLLPDDLSQLHSLADQMREILRRTS